MEVIIIDLPGYEGGLEQLAESTSLPVLQDTTEAGVAEAYGAASDYLYFIDAEGYPRFVHYGIEIDDNADRLLGQLAELTGGR